MMTTLNKFISKSTQHILHSIKYLRKNYVFKWILECQQEFEFLKMVLSTPPILSRHSFREVFYLYLGVSDETINAFLVRDLNLTQSPLYFISKALVGLEMHYQNIENEAFVLVNTSIKLRRYFLTHTIVV